MHIITERELRRAAALYPNTAPAISRWIQITRKALWKNLAETRATFPHADAVKTDAGRTLTVFNLSDGFRLIAAIHYNRNKVYIRAVLTHAEYDRGRWKQES